jgi:hypothetical protein
MPVLPIGLALLVAITAAAQPGQFPLQRAETDSEATWQSDIFLAESGVRYEQEWEALRWDVAFTHNAYGIEYEPFSPYDFLGFTEVLHEDRFAGLARLRPRIGDRLTLTASGGIYDGYQDYRHVWLANYYRQQYSQPPFPQRPGYEEPDPKGWNLSAGARWEYWPELGFLEAQLGYSVDDVAPGFVEDPRTGFVIRGRPRLYTTSGGLTFENVLSSRLRALNEVRVSATSERELRWSVQSSLNCALGERWVFRALGGYTAEEPKFEAFWYGAALEFEAAKWCTIIASGQYYEDTGEVLDPFVLTSAAPELRSQYFTIGLRFTWSRFVIKISGGPYNTDYDELAASSRAFTNLYRDRNWALAQGSIALSY